MLNDNAYLVIEKGEPYRPQELFPLLHDKFLIGRVWDNHQPDLAFSDQSVSRNHAEISIDDGRYFIQDLSRNGVKIIDGPRLEKNTPYELKHGNRISLADGCVILAFYIGTQPGETIPRTQNFLEIILDEKKKLITIEGREVYLSNQSYLLFRLLHQHRSEVVSHQTIINTIWPGEDGILRGSQEVTSLVKRLRYELANNDIISTIPKSGYKLK